ncbi:MAG: hypothetical protein EXX96DRAFT_556347 [Benjaminiella poitrasii]|nr:MAG: hypothetical protein EXX96DRAFT_556347 [Benjaminiella poitrasii]
MKFFATLIAIAAAMTLLVVTAAPNSQACHRDTNSYDNSVCKKFCGKSGYLLGECGNEGICVCKNKQKSSTTILNIHRGQVHSPVKIITEPKKTVTTTKTLSSQKKRKVVRKTITRVKKVITKTVTVTGSRPHRTASSSKPINNRVPIVVPNKKASLAPTKTTKQPKESAATFTTILYF